MGSGTPSECAHPRVICLIHAPLVGLGDYWAGDTDPERTFSAIPAMDTAPIIVLLHNPDAKDLVTGYPWDLMLCGHTHGGQLYLPGIGRPFAPISDLRFVSGLNPWRGKPIYTTNGVGNLRGLRFNCRPEISILDVS